MTTLTLTQLTALSNLPQRDIAIHLLNAAAVSPIVHHWLTEKSETKCIHAGAMYASCFVAAYPVEASIEISRLTSKFAPK